MKKRDDSWRGQVYEVEITDLATGGKGIAKIDGKVVFVEKGIPGQKVKISLYKNKKDYSEARVVETISEGEYYTKPRCGYFQICGGCAIQNMKYNYQIFYKKKWVEESLRKIGKLPDVPVKDISGSEDEFFYRNKMEFTFSDKIWDPDEKCIKTGAMGLGMHLPGRFDTVVNITECFLQSEKSAKIVNLVREFAEKSGLPAYNAQRHTGFWRYLIIREGKNTGEVLLNIVTNKCGESQNALIDDIASQITKEFGEINAFLHSEHPGKSQAAILTNIRQVSGAKYINEKIGAFRFQIESDTFFQVNSKHVVKLYDLVKEAGELSGKEVVYDLFSGVGTIPVYIANKCKSVLGIELNPKSVEAAKENAKRNGIGNCRFIQGKVRAEIKYPPALFKEHGKPDVVIIDPPRSGMDPKTVSRVTQLGAKRIIYVSCNPATLSRDLQVMSESYSVDEVCPVDMFPHTAHVESVAKLTKK